MCRDLRFEENLDGQKLLGVSTSGQQFCHTFHRENMNGRGYGLSRAHCDNSLHPQSFDVDDFRTTVVFAPQSLDILQIDR